MSRSCLLWRFCQALWLALLANGVGAVEVPDLLTARIAVADQKAHALQPVLARGLGEVLVKVSGNPRAAALAHEMPAQRIQGLLGRFSYRPSPQNSEFPLTLELTFTRAGVTQLLATSGLAAWDNDRPLTLLWIGLDDGTRRILGEDDPLARSARELASRRGLPLITPLMDLQEQGLVSPGTLWLNDLDRLEGISTSYRPDLLGVLFLSRDSTGWRARLTTRVDGQDHSVQSSASSARQALEAAINALADQVSGLYGPASLSGSVLDNPDTTATGQPGSLSGQPAPGLLLVVRGVMSAEDFAQLYAYLMGLDGIGRVTPTAITDSELVFRLDYGGDPQAVRRRLSLENHLYPIDQASTQDSYREPRLIYRLLSWRRTSATPSE